jgi:protein-tyrosine-phosphatase
MVGILFAELPVRVVTAGTFVVEGQPMSWRTRDALASVGVEALPAHRSHQLTEADVAEADLIIAMAGEHVAYVRRRHPEAAGRTATIKRLVRDLTDGPESLGERVVALGLGAIEPEPWEDVEDPAGGEVEVYVSCAKELAQLCAELSPRLR